MIAYRIGSLFSGIGGLELGLERAGVGCVAWQCEIDPFARSVLARHWPGVTRFEDIRELGRTIDVPAVDVLCGGFPCQDISLAGKGAGLEGERSGLWFEYLRLIRDLRPRFVVLENVAAILVRGAGDVLGGLAALGYDAWWDCIPAAAVGAPHRRDRWFCVAWLADRDGERLEGRRSWRGEDGRETPARPARPARPAHGGGLHPSVADVLRDVRARGPWSPESRLGRGAHGLPARVDGRSLTWPTPDAAVSNDGEDIAGWMERRKRVRESRGNGNGFGVPLAMAARLWPTPTANDSRDAGYHGSGGREFPTLPGAVGGATLPGGVPWPTRPVEPWERGVPRTIDPKSDPNRRPRLRALGNAVVPQVAEVVGRVVLEIDRALRAVEAA